MVCLKIIWKILQLMVLHGDLEFSDIVALTITVTVQFFFACNHYCLFIPSALPTAASYIL